MVRRLDRQAPVWSAELASSNTQPEFSHVVEIDQVGPEGLALRLEADAEARAALAKRFRIPAVLSLVAELTLIPEAAPGHFRLQGSLDAEVEQTCVVSLEPLRQQVRERFERRFAPGAPEPKAGSGTDEDDAEWLDPDSDDPPEPIPDGRLDLGQIVAEELALGLDPYPRRPGATLPEGYALPADEGKVSPFAALAKLKKGQP